MQCTFFVLDIWNLLGAAWEKVLALALFSGRKGMQRRLVGCLLNNLKSLGETKIKDHLLLPEPYFALSV